MKILTILTVMVVSFVLGVFRGERKVVQVKKAVKTEIVKIRKTNEVIKSLKKKLLDAKNETEAILQIANENARKCEANMLKSKIEIERLDEQIKNLEYDYRDNLNVDKKYKEDKVKENLYPEKLNRDNEENYNFNDGENYENE